MSISSCFRPPCLLFFLCLPLMTNLLATRAFAWCYGPSTFQTCENGDGDSLITVREGHISWATGYDATTKEAYQRFSTSYGRSTYSDSINFHAQTSTEKTDNYSSDQFHVEGQKYDKRGYSLLCSVRLGCS